MKEEHSTSRTVLHLKTFVLPELNSGYFDQKRARPGWRKGDCNSCSPPIVTHMFSFFTAVLPPNQKGQQTIQRAGSWTCWGDDLPGLTSLPSKIIKFWIVYSWEYFLYYDCPWPIEKWKEDAKRTRAIHLNSSWEQYQAVNCIESQIIHSFLYQ